MLTETTINIFKNNIISKEITNQHNILLNEELHLPHGITSAKVVCHVDLDGVCSGISMVQQLIKQGIKKDRITVEFAQYGDDEKQAKAGKNFADTFQNKNKQQWVGVTDFAKYPRFKLWEKFNQLMSFKGNKHLLVSFINSRDFTKMTNFEDFKSLFERTFNLKESNEKPVKDLFDACRAYCLYSKKENPITLQNVEDYKIQLAKPDFGSDHHSNDFGELTSAKRGDLAAKSPSEAEFFASKYAPGMWSQDDLKAISMVDSAGYTKDELKNSVFLQKQFNGPNRKRNLAQIVSVIYDSLCKKDERVAKWIILNSGPSLVSLYSHVKEGLKFNGERLRLLEALKNGDFKTGKEIAEALPKILNKNWTNIDGPNYHDRNGGEIKKASNFDEYREKNIQDLAKAKTGRKNEADEKKLSEVKNKRTKEAKEIKADINSKKGRIMIYNNFGIFDGTSTREQYQRYLQSLLNKDGKMPPYSMRYWGNMFQISLNPIYSNACKAAGETDIMDFSIINDHIKEDVYKYLKTQGISDFNAKRFSDVIEGGGHKTAIWTISKFDKIRPSSKELGEKYWSDMDMMKKANSIDQNRGGKEEKTTKGKIEVLKKYAKNAAERLETAENGVNAKYKKIREGAVRAAMNSAVHWMNKLYPPKEAGLKACEDKDSRFTLEK